MKQNQQSVGEDIPFSDSLRGKAVHVDICCNI